MNLFTVESGILVPVPETLLIYPFNEIWNRDTSPKKDMAVKEFTYVEFLCSYKKSNPFAGYVEEGKEAKVRDNIFKKTPNWIPDGLVKDAITVYKDFQEEASPSLRFYNAAIVGVTKLQDYYDTLDMNERTNQGGLVNKPSDVARGLSQTATVLQNLEALKTKVEQELFESNKLRANRTVNPLER
jgi:hypothetical protein